MLLGVLLDEHHTHVGVAERLDAVADAHDELVLVLAALDKVGARDARVVRFGEHLGGVVQGTAEAGADGQQTGGQRGDQVLQQQNSAD